MCSAVCCTYRAVPHGCPQSSTVHLPQPPHFLQSIITFLFPLSCFSCMCIQTPLKLLSWLVSYLAGLPSFAFQIAPLCICPSSGLLLSSAFPSSCFFHGLFLSSSVTSRCSLHYPSLLPIHLFLSSPQQFFLTPLHWFQASPGIFKRHPTSSLHLHVAYIVKCTKFSPLNRGWVELGGDLLDRSLTCSFCRCGQMCCPS